MLFIIQQKATPEEIEKASEEYDGYIKFVVDIEQEIAMIGGERHVDGEKELLESGSRQENLWGGGLDVEKKEIDYNSMINLRPNQDNPSRDVLSSAVRQKIDRIVKKLLL